jgi:hypothetical protein
VLNKNPFFSSVKHPGLHMNKYGVVLIDRSHPVAAGEEFWPRDWDRIPVPNGNLKLKEDVHDEVREAGYTYEFIGGGERLFKKPVKLIPQGTAT